MSGQLSFSQSVSGDCLSRMVPLLLLLSLTVSLTAAAPWIQEQEQLDVGEQIWKIVIQQ